MEILIVQRFSKNGGATTACRTKRRELQISSIEFLYLKVGIPRITCCSLNISAGLCTYCSISDVKSMKLHSISIEIFTIEYCLRQPNYVLVSRHLKGWHT